GGFHATARPEDLLKSDCVDVVVRGEGEETLLELAENVKNGIYDFKAIKGISYKNADGTISHTPERGLINPLDNIPFPRRELIFDYDKYTPEQLGWIMTSRGCPYDCAYCNSKTIWERKVRFSPLEKVIDEINYLKTTFNSIHINFMDDSFTVNRNRVLKLCSMLIENKTGITWACLTRADLIDDEIAVSMKKAGCIKVDIGIESGNKRMQQLINKGIKLEDVRKSSDILKKHGIFWTGFFMMGFPTETKEEILETLKFMKEVNPNWAYLNIFTPYPGSKFYDMVEGDKLFQQQNNINIYSHQSPNNCFSTNISRDEFKKVVKLMFKEFNRHNSSLRSLLRRAYSKKYHRNPKQFLKDAGKVLSWLRP
ncbi:MAG: radical SAM protein, partial [Nitrospirae bacterium]|nr:radical SAM protein [Nitrospirota bacterium]